MREENIAAVEAFLDALRVKDLGRAPLAEDVLFADPISGPGRGADNLRAFLSGFLPAIAEVRVRRHVCEDDFVVTHWEVDGVFGIIQILEEFRVRDGQIVGTHRFFDPRPVLG